MWKISIFQFIKQNCTTKKCYNDIPKKDSAYLLTTTEPQKNVTDINQN